MATFIMLSRLSPEGMKTLRSNPERLREVNQEVEGFGARVVQQYALLGPYDFITVLEAPDAGTVSRVSVELSSRATASYETLTAIEVEEFISRIRGEGAHAYGAQQPTAEPTPTGGRPEGTAIPMEGATFEPTQRTEEAPPPRTGGIEEGVGPSRSGEVPPRTEGVPPREEGLTGDIPPRTEEAAPTGREGARQPEREQEEEEDKGLIDRARDAIMAEEEEEPRRRREGTDRADREDRLSGR
jgi:uncharacterized protein with GYD domain